MYHQTVLQRPQPEDDERMQRENGTRAGSPQGPTGAATSSASLSASTPITATSPRHSRSHFTAANNPPINNTAPAATSPTNGSYFRSTYKESQSYPQATQAPAQSPMISHSPHSPIVKSPLLTPAKGVQSMNGPHGPSPTGGPKPSSTYYDPTSDHGDAAASWAQSSRTQPSPSHMRSHREAPGHVDPSTEPTAVTSGALNGSRRSPDNLHFHQVPSPQSHSRSRPASRLPSVSQSPGKLANGSPLLPQNGTFVQPAGSLANHSTSSLSNSRRPADPMSFSSILSSSNAEAPPQTAHLQTSPAEVASSGSSRAGTKHSLSVEETMTRPFKAPRRTSNRTSAPGTEAEVSTRTESGSMAKGKSLAALNKENEVALAKAQLDEASLSDLDLPEFDAAKVRFKSSSRKRLLDVEADEATKRKRRRLAFTEALTYSLGDHAERGEKRFRRQFKDAAVAEVQQKEVLDEKERKKDMQRKRRREKTVQNEYQKRNEALQKAQRAADEAEKAKLFKEAARAEKKARATTLILQRGDGGKELREVTPLAPNLEGGTMTSFSTTIAAAGSATTPTPTPTTTTGKAAAEPKRKKAGKGGSRPKKSKEQKKAEKSAAEAAHAAIENNELPTIAPKEEEKREPARKEAKEPKAKRVEAFVPYVSKGYNQIYEQIWRDIARKDIPRVCRIKETSLSTKTSNLRKTAQLASKEARRWQLRTNKSMKDVQSRAKKSMREMSSFWKRNEREERDMRRMAEKQELENAKKAEADREANRQKRKLNFLISQTELYSHFIGRKVKTDEVERSTDSPDVAPTGSGVAPGAPTAALSLANDDNADGQGAAARVTDFENLDFDDTDDSKLRAIASANAQHAIQEAKDRARSFDLAGKAEQELKDAEFDEGEMNFQNPTSLGDTNVGQPKLLTAQLKEYQLKGLNWLVNLYEQGINGILADEMGLGKTVQSISLITYLAESHNIWGPFLVIAPASTLHNWQQEISKFVPALKVLPYWGNARDRKVLRKFWDRKHITYSRDSPFHVLVTSYQLVVQDTQYFQKVRWQYMILDEAQAIKSSSSSRWKSLLGFHCRNRLLLTGTPIQNNMQELWALLHFIMPTLFDSHDEFAEWFSKDIESHAQSNTKLNEDQLKRLHVILKPFMLRRIKKHVQKELGDKIELDVFCDLTYRQRAYYSNLRNKISIMDIIERAAVGDDQDAHTLMNLVMQFRKVCNHPDLFERAETASPFVPAHFAETASFLREGQNVNLGYSTRNLIEYGLPRLIWRGGARLDVPGPDNARAGFHGRYLDNLMNIWTPENVRDSMNADGAFSWLRFADQSPGEAASAFHTGVFSRAVGLKASGRQLGRFKVFDDDDDGSRYSPPAHAMLNIVDGNDRRPLAEVTNEGRLKALFTVAETVLADAGLTMIEPCARPAASAPPIDVCCASSGTERERQNILFNVPVRKALFPASDLEEKRLVEAKVDGAALPVRGMLPAPGSAKGRYTNISVPSMRRFVTDSGKLAQLDRLLQELKEGGHRVLLYFQMTKMIDLMEEYLTYRNFKYLRLDGSTKLEDRRDTVHDFQTRPDIFIFLLSTRAGGLGINLTAADTVIFYDSDWNPTIDSQAMDRAHRLGQKRQVTVYRMITRGTIEERIRKRALQKEEVQRVVISGGGGSGVDFNTRSRENRTKDIAMWLADDDQAAEIERKEAEIAAAEAKEPPGKKRAAKKRKADVSLDDMYHEGEGHFDDGSNKPSGAATPVSAGDVPTARGKKGAATTTKTGRVSKKAKTAKERLRLADGDGGLE